ncbi:pentapeptide repeat-containing protein [Corynebacterium sp. TAE3-ERU16]|uniref:pentapeptide repeat-containing protein n=1 Tax=Corynebacterium sp. TAE3-ERU16 TaxID=2849493 RepID=UPI001C491C53|nr:pentapeptide repeat-containing protein [Corynebacterium sp. TAE3-ERU16]MBV7293679.1 pentapeptide repeat-containing protein [Corynebacterium sp. TAE3-ERU16]
MTSAPDKEPDASGDGVQPEKKTINRWKMYVKLRTVLVGAPFVLLPAGLIGTGWKRIAADIQVIRGCYGGYYSFGFVIVVLGLGLWLLEPIEPNDKDGASGVADPKAPHSRFSWIEIFFVLFSLLSLAGGIRVVTVMQEEGDGQLAAGLFAASGLALSVWATQRRSIEQQEREDRRQNDRLESESLRESRQLSVQQRMDMSKKLQTSIEHLANDSEVVRAAAISELMFQIDDWNALIRGEITEIEARKLHDAKERVEQLKAEGLLRRQELFDLAMKDYVEGHQYPHNDSSSENAGKYGKRELREGIIAARRRGLKSAQKGSFDGVNFEGVRLPNLPFSRLLVPANTEKNEEEKRIQTWKSHLRGVDLGSAHLEGANLARAHLEEANLARAHLEEANLVWVHAVKVKLGKANLARANLECANLHKADLKDAHLEGASLWGSILEGANLRGAHLEGAKLAAKNNDGSLSMPCTFDEKTQCRGATYSSTTVFPEGFDPEAHGMKLVDDPEPEDED